MGNATESTYAYNQQRKRLQSRPRTANKGSIMQRQRHAAIYSRLSTCRKHTERLQPNPLLMHNHVLPHTNGAAISQQRLEFESHFLSATTAQRCHALKPNKYTSSMVMSCLPAHQTPPRCKLSQAVCPIKLVSLWLPRFGLLKPNPPG